MSVSTQTFLDLCLAGEVDADEIDDFVDKWHDSDQTDISLPEYLGMTEDEYSLWVDDPDNLGVIIYARKNNLPLKDAVRVVSEQLATRNGSKEDAERLKKWLQLKGL